MQYHVIYEYWQLCFFFPNMEVFSFFLSFFFFFGLIAGARASNTVLNKSGKNGHPCFVPDLTEKDFQIFTIECDVSCGFFIYSLDYVEVFSSMPNFWGLFIVYCCWILSNVFYVSMEMIVWLISFFVLMGCIMLIDF